MSRRDERIHKTKKAHRRARARLLRAVAACEANPADMLELYYWSKEPGFTGLIRAIATMPEHTRAALETFIMLRATRNPSQPTLIGAVCSLFAQPKPPGVRRLRRTRATRPTRGRCCSIDAALSIDSYVHSGD